MSAMDAASELLKGLVAPIASAVTKAGIGILKTWYPGNSDEKAEREASEVVRKTYETLRGRLTDKTVQVLILLERGEFFTPRQIRAKLYPTLEVSGELGDALDHEFRYRLEYLLARGLLAFVSPSEYRITWLGRAFLAEARRRREPIRGLFPEH